MDKDGDGVISKDEWSEWCKKQLEFEIEDADDAACVEKMFLADQKQIEDNFQKLDIDGDGQIDISEICFISFLLRQIWIVKFYVIYSVQ